MYQDAQWVIHYGELQEAKLRRGRPPTAASTEHLFRIVGEKLPFDALDDVRRHLKDQGHSTNGVYIAHDSMGCPRYIGRGNIFQRLAARKKRNQLELAYFSFYVVAAKKHEREIETLLIRAASFLLEFNNKKRRVGILPGAVGDYEAGTIFYQRQYTRGARP